MVASLAQLLKGVFPALCFPIIYFVPYQFYNAFFPYLLQSVQALVYHQLWLLHLLYVI